MRKLLACCVTSLAALVATLPCHCAPAVNTRSGQEEYLRKFSYLGRTNPDPSMAALQDEPEKQFQMAIRSFQRFAGVNVTGVVDAPTRRMMETPRCGVADLVGFSSFARRKRRFDSPGHKWQKTDLTYRFDRTKMTQDLSETIIKREFRRAFQAWSDVSTLTFTETNSLPVDIEILFGPGKHTDNCNGPFDGPGGTLAHAYFPGDGIGGDAHFDDDETFTSEQPTGTNLFQVAVHELGHSLGLGHSDDQSAVMAPFYRGFNPTFKLGQDDIEGITHLYGSRGSRPVTSRPTQPPSRVTTRPVARPTPPSNTQLQRICNNPSFDAIDFVDGTLHAFQGAYYIQLDPERRVGSGSPRLISERWPGVPSNLDAVVSSDPYKGPTFFFKGSYYWKYIQGTQPQRLLIRDGFPRVPDNIDAAFMWSGNNQLYFIKGDLYYKFRGGYGVDPDYPKPTRYWKDLPRVVNDAFKHTDRKTYFFDARSYYIFNDIDFKAGSPRSITSWIPDCANAESYSSSATTTTTTKLHTSRHIATSLALLTVQLVVITLASTANHIPPF